MVIQALARPEVSSIATTAMAGSMSVSARPGRQVSAWSVIAS